MSANEAPPTSKDPHLPPMGRLDNVVCPRAPTTIADARLEEGTLTDLAIKFSSIINRFTDEWLAQQMKITNALGTAIVAQLLSEGLIEETLMTTGGKTTYRISDRGRRIAERALEVCTYLGPAPVSLEAYSAMTRWEFSRAPEVKPKHVTTALESLVLTRESIEMAGLAVSSGRSLFIYGPSGNGKSSIGRQIHSAMRGDIWIPHSIAVRNSVIRLYDEQVHQKVDVGGDKASMIDQRWVRVRRPMVVVGGELTLEYLDLVFSPSVKYYEAPPHLKANGGVFLVDDFGRERVSPHQLLNRFITPMEHSFDYFTLSTGQKIQVPLRQVLIIATNLSLEKVTDPAFLRRMGYRLSLEPPNEEQYARIFRNYAAKYNAEIPAGLLEGILAKYRAQERPLRACEPRDLIERSRDICRFREQPLALSQEVIDLAWLGYFGAGGPVKSTEGGGIALAHAPDASK